MSTQLPAQFGQYTLLKLLARGGMGEIYLARTAGMSNFEKYYAIKKLLRKFTHDRDVGARFIDEAKLGARLQHPNIVQVYDLGAVSDELYMATEFVDGFDLRRVLRYCHEKKKRIPLDVALFVVREILSGLAYAHRQVDADGQSIDLIHRDISPQNVLVSFEGEVKIIDFGLAKSTQRSQETQANVLLGNFGYMSPEQARGHKLDVRTDVYSAGIVLFELTTGTKRFVDDNPLRLLEMVARPTPIMPSDRSPEIPTAIDQMYAQATAPPRDQRYSTAELFRDEVTAVLHRINPKAGREHLAQFLNHLFLGGEPPPPVDPDLLDKSITVQVQELVANTAAFQKSKEEDTRDRSMTAFAEDAPQTGSHEGMRAARVGDVLSHEELMGLAAAAEAAFAQVPGSGEAQFSASVPDPDAADVEGTFASFASSAETEEPALAQGATLGASIEPKPPESMAPELEAPASEEEVIEIALSDDGSAEDSVVEGEPISWHDAPASDTLQAEEHLSAGPTSVYDAPSFHPVDDGHTRPSANLNPNLDSDPSSEPPELSFHSTYPPPRESRSDDEPVVGDPLPVTAHGDVTDEHSGVDLELPMPPPSPPATFSRNLDTDETEAYSKAEPLVVGKALPTPTESKVVVSTVGSSTHGRDRSEEAEPSEPTMVVNLGDDASEPPPFGEGAMMESLIIDFDEGGGDGVFEDPPPPPPEFPPETDTGQGGGMPLPPQSDPSMENRTLTSDEGQPVTAGGTPVIRPAAQPLGRVSKARTKPMSPAPPKKK